MTCDLCGAPMKDESVTYTIQLDDRLFVVEHVPARVCIQCGERLYSPETVERLQKAVWEKRPPVRTLETPVYDFAMLSPSPSSLPPRERGKG